MSVDRSGMTCVNAISCEQNAQHSLVLRFLFPKAQKMLEYAYLFYG